MFSIGRILLPTDFSKRSYGALRYAVALCHRFHAELLILHVLPAHQEEPMLDFGGAILTRLLAGRRAEAQRWLDSVAAEASDAGIHARTELREGAPAVEIVALARECQCGLMVMSSQGHGVFRRYLLGGVTAKVLHDAAGPVWTGVHVAEAPEPREIAIRRVGCAVSSEPGDERVARWASEFAEAFDAQVSLIHAARQDEPTDRLRQWQQALGLSGPFVVERGEVTATVVTAARNAAVDVLVIGRSRAEGGRLRAPSYELIRESPCPVISV